MDVNQNTPFVPKKSSYQNTPWIIMVILLIGYSVLNIYQLEKKQEIPKHSKHAYQVLTKQVEMALGLNYIIEQHAHELPVSKESLNLSVSIPHIISEIIDTRETDYKHALLYLSLRSKNGDPITEKDILITKESFTKEQKKHQLKDSAEYKTLDFLDKHIISILDDIYLKEKPDKTLLKTYHEKLLLYLDHKNYSDYLLHFLVASDMEHKLNMNSIYSKLYPFLESNIKNYAFIGISLIGLLLLSIFVWIYYFTVRNDGQCKPLGSPLYIRSHDDNSRFLSLSLLVFLFVFILLPFVVTIARLLFQNAPFQTTLFTLCLHALSFAVSIYFFNKIIRFLNKNLIQLLGKVKNIFLYLKWIILGYLANILVLFIAGILSWWLIPYLPSPSHPIESFLSRQSSVYDILLIYFLAAVQAPVLEEIFFRGIIFPICTRKFSSVWVGAIISGFIFAIIHPQGPSLWPVLTAMGAMLAFVTYHTKSIIPSICIHAIHNTLILTLAFSSISSECFHMNMIELLTFYIFR